MVAEKNKIRVGIIGLGMVGGPIRRWFEEKMGYKRGKNLFCFDVDTRKKCSDDVNRADVIFVAVPTPPLRNGGCDTSILEDAVERIQNGKIVVIKSTVVPGTVHALQKKYPKKRFIFNPEFLTESQVWEDFLSPDRQIVAHTDKSMHDTVEILQMLPKKHFIRPWTTDYTKKSVHTTEAELIKYASNVFGYMKVIYGNILADTCHALNLKFRKDKKHAHVSYEHVREMLGADLRIGSAWLNVEHGAYCGAGGFCFPKDMAAFIVFTEQLARELPSRKKSDVEFIKLFRSGIEVLKAISRYNKMLLESQGLTIEDVSMHDKEIAIRKRKKIRK